MEGKIKKISLTTGFLIYCKIVYLLDFLLIRSILYTQGSYIIYHLVSWVVLFKPVLTYAKHADQRKLSELHSRACVCVSMCLVFFF